MCANGSMAAARAAWTVKSAWAAYNVAESTFDLYETVGVFATEQDSLQKKGMRGPAFRMDLDWASPWLHAVLST